MSSIYITGITPQSKSSNDRNQTAENKFKTIQNDYLEFLIQQETNFANIGSIKDYYIAQLHQQHTKYNKNKRIIKEKEIEYTNLLKLIEHEIIGKYKITFETLMNYYHDKSSALQYDIKIKEDELRRYSSIYNRLYHCNFMLNRRVQNEMKIENTNESQIPQYKRQNHYAVLSMSQKKGTLAQILSYNDIVLVKYKSDVDEKEKELNGLLAQVDELKKDILAQENSLSCLIDKVKTISNEVDQIDELNATIYNEYKTSGTEYHKTKILLSTLMCKTKTEEINEFIKQNIARKIDYHNFTSAFHFDNNEIAKLAREINMLNEELSNLNKKIAIKKQREKNEVYEDAVINKNKSKIKHIEYILTEMNGSLRDKNKVLQYIIDYCVLYSKSMIKSELIPIDINDNSIAYDLLSGNASSFYLPFEELDKESIKCIISLFHQLSLGVFKVFYSFLESKIASSQSNEMNCISKHGRSKAHRYSNNSNSGGIDNNIPRKSVDIINLFSTIPYSINPKNSLKQKRSLFANTPNLNLNQSQNLNQSPNEFQDEKHIGKEFEEIKEMQSTLSATQMNFKRKHLSEGKITTQAEMLKKFKNYLKDIDNRQREKSKLNISNQEVVSAITNNSNKRNLITNSPRRLKVLFSKFQNEFVISDKTFQTLKKQKADLHPMQKTIIFPRRNSRIELQEAMSRFRKLTTSSSEEDEIQDSFEESNNPKSTRETNYKIINHQHNKLQYKFLHKNTEVNQIYHRINDLRSLDYKNFRKRDVELCKDTFDLAYYSLINKDNPKNLKIKSKYLLKNTQDNKEKGFYPNLFLRYNKNNDNDNDVTSIKKTRSNANEKKLYKTMSSPLFSNSLK